MSLTRSSTPLAASSGPTQIYRLSRTISHPNVIELQDVVDVGLGTGALFVDLQDQNIRGVVHELARSEQTSLVALGTVSFRDLGIVELLQKGAIDVVLEGLPYRVCSLRCWHSVGRSRGLR